MYNSIRILQSVASQSGRPLNRGRHAMGQLGVGLSTACLCALGMGGWPKLAYAESVAPDTAQVDTDAPPALTEQLAQVDMAANQKIWPNCLAFTVPILRVAMA